MITHSVVAGRGRDHLAERIEDHRVADVREPVAGADPVHADDVRLVLDRARRAASADQCARRCRGQLAGTT